MAASKEEISSSFFTNKFGDRYLYEVNRTTFSQVGSDTLYNKNYKSQLFEENKLYVVLGTDSGLLLQYLLGKDLPDGSRYIFVEHPFVLEHLHDQLLPGGLPENISLISLDYLEGQAKAFKLTQYVYADAVKIVDSFAVKTGFYSPYRDLATAVRTWIQDRLFGIAVSTDSTFFMTRMIENLAENRCPAQALKGFCENKTAVILAGGPSLDEFLPWVKANQERLIIVAVSRISKRLLQENLTPHFIVSIDPLDVSFDVSKDMLKFYDRSIFIHSSYASPGLLGQWRGHSLYLGPCFPWNTSLYKENIESTGPTVTNSALTLTIAMGCSQVVLVGVDLCFSRLGYTHAQGNSEAAAPLISSSAVRVETNRGEMAETTVQYRSAVSILGKQAAKALDRGCNIVTPALDGAKIPNVNFVPIEQIVLPPASEFSFDDVVMLSEQSTSERSDHYQIVFKELLRAEKDLSALRSLAKEALVCNDGLFGRKGKKRNFKYKLRLDDIEKKINTQYEDFSSSLKKFSVRRFLKITRVDDSKKMTDAEIEKSGRIYYETFRDSAEEMLSLILGAKKRLEARIEEEKENPNIEMLVQQWRNDKQPGRLMVWQARRQSVDSEIDSYTEQLTAEYQAQMSDNKFAEMMIAHHNNLSRVRGKALALFQESRCQDLENLLSALKVHPSHETAVSFIVLVEGYLNECKGLQDEALSNYQQLINETFDDVTEDVLRRIASLSLAQKNWEMALLALECLKNAATYYLPQYADLLRILGEHQGAADAYVDYLELVPDDLTIMLKLGQLYRSMGHENEAKQVFRLVLDHEPQNREAKELLKSD